MGHFNHSGYIRTVVVCSFLIFLLPHSCELRRLTNDHDADVNLDYESSATRVLNEKYEDLLYLTSKHPLIKLGSREFSKYVAEVPRNYTTILLLTDERTSYSSHECNIARSSLDIIAYSYHSQNLSRPKIFFVEVCRDDSPELFSQIGVPLDEVPSIFYVPTKGMLMNLVELDQGTYSLHTQSLLSWIFDRTGVQIGIKSYPKAAAVQEQKGGILTSPSMSLLMLGFYLYYKRDVVIYVINLILNEPGAVGILVVSLILLFISGIMYCHIDGAALFYRNPRTGDIFVVYPSNDSQFLVEFVIVYSLYGMIVYGMVQLIELPEKMKQQKENTANKQDEQQDPSVNFALSSVMVPFFMVLMLAKYKMGNE